ncbi:MAG TPA: hypothetical protein VLF60_01740 [Candidatus Saccharimonadales bacterium]|nr:hypothetical protein [Candidatus Saccharimonadales bacterium]
MVFGEITTDPVAAGLTIDESNGRVSIHPSAEVGIGCSLIGPVEVHEGAVLLEDTTVEASTIHPYAFVGMGVTVVRSVIGRGAAVQSNTPRVENMTVGDFRGHGHRIVVIESVGPAIVLCSLSRDEASEGKAPKIATRRRSSLLID